MAKVEAVAVDDAFVPASELVERARAMAPRLRERSRKAEQLRMLPPETVQDFKDAGFIRMLQPRRFGGMAHDLEVGVDVSIEVARACAASGWLSAFMPIHNFMVSWFSEEAQAEYWASGPDTLSSTIPAYRGAIREEVKGGLMISGRASFSSGVDYSEWALLSTAMETLLIPKKDFEIVDDWDVSGLRGTGSKGVAFKDVFVPQHRIVSNTDLQAGTYPGSKLSDSPWLHVRNPAILILNHGILAPVIGMGRGVLDIFDERARNRLDAQTFLPAIERPGPQLRFAEASAELDAAEMFLRRNLATVRAAGATGGEMTLEARALIRRNIVYASKLVLQATNRLVDGMDSSALYEKNPLHRQARDVRAGSLQFVLHWEETAMQYARVHWGLDPQTMMI
jgi:3-hydroxy-9,10-secoandrosta-1,3,5(10)-triene-9,17-dione monooxygenase